RGVHQQWQEQQNYKQGKTFHLWQSGKFMEVKRGASKCASIAAAGIIHGRFSALCEGELSSWRGVVPANSFVRSIGYVRMNSHLHAHRLRANEFAPTCGLAPFIE